MSSFGVVDLTAAPSAAPSAVEPMWGKPTVDPENVKRELEEIRNALQPLLSSADDDSSEHFALKQLEVKLAVGLEGSIYFVAKGSVEASITLTFAKD